MTLSALLLSAGLLASPAALSQAPLDALRATLDALPGTAPIRAQVEHRFERQRDGQPAPTGQATPARAHLAAGADGLTVTWGREALDELHRERDRRAADADARTPVMDAMSDLDAASCARLLDGAAELRHDLDRATVLEARDEPLDGAPARLLRLRLDPDLPASQRKYVKELDATMSLWLGQDGVPLAAEVRVKASGRAMLVIGFSSVQQERYRFAHVGDRLVVTRREFDQHSEGGGERGATKSSTTLMVER
ncbi:MAG: hypothetical protein QM767_27715 [Anaeromyxobacter sp.]